MAAAPAIVTFVGGSSELAMSSTLAMYDITLGEHPVFKLPPLDFRGTPVGIDAALVVRRNRVPVVNTGIAGRTAGVGQVGAGLVDPPIGCFEAALRRFAELNRDTLGRDRRAVDKASPWPHAFCLLGQHIAESESSHLPQR